MAAPYRRTTRRGGTAAASGHPGPMAPYLTRLVGVRRGIADSRTAVGRHAHWWDANNRRTIARLSTAGSGAPGWMLALGDSAAQGVGGGHPSLGWVGQLAAIGDRTDRVVNLSVSGARVGDLVDAQLPRAEELLDLLGPPEATVIHIGGNDLFRPGNPLSFGRGLRSLGGCLRVSLSGSSR